MEDSRGWGELERGERVSKRLEQRRQRSRFYER